MHQDVRAALQKKLERLQQRVGKIERDLRQTPEPDSEERAVSRENDEVLEHLEDSGQKELQLLQAALARIDAGTYGICTTCGKQISPSRLKALPYTMTCLRCAHKTNA
jgi:RNA polymerase-binding protein DksA